MKALVVAIMLLLSVATYSESQIPKLPNLKEFKCLVENIYHEARGEPKEGKIAVGRVTLNRLAHKDYPKTICTVVYERKQFSWTNTPKRSKINPVEWQQSAEAAAIAYNSTGEFKATHYHNFTVNPNWGFKKIATIGRHIFFVQ